MTEEKILNEKNDELDEETLKNLRKRLYFVEVDNSRRAKKKKDAEMAKDFVSIIQSVVNFRGK